MRIYDPRCVPGGTAFSGEGHDVCRRVRLFMTSTPGRAPRTGTVCGRESPVPSSRPSKVCAIGVFRRFKIYRSPEAVKSGPDGSFHSLGSALRSPAGVCSYGRRDAGECLERSRRGVPATLNVGLLLNAAFAASMSVRGRGQGPSLLRMGRHRPRRPPPRESAAAVRRDRSTGELAYYRRYSPASVPLTVLVTIAGSRWRVEEFFQSGKGLAALDGTRSAAIPPGPAGSPSPCSRTPSSPSYARTSTPAPYPMPSFRSPATRSSACSSPSSSDPSTTQPTGPVGHTGGAAARPDSRPATTGSKPLGHEDHDLRLEY